MFFDLESSMECIINNSGNLKFIKEVTNAFRFLRNSCVLNKEIQDQIIKNPKIVKSCENFLQTIIFNNEFNKEEYCLTVIVGLQFLGNLVVNNKNNQIIVWYICKDLFDNCLSNKHIKIKNCSLMIIYNILLGNPKFISELSHSYENIIQLLELENTLEYTVFICELLILNINYLNKFYHQLNIKSRILLLGEIQRIISDFNKFHIEPPVIHFYASQFSLKANWILNMTLDNADFLKAVEAVKILDVMVKFSCNDSRYYLEQIQKETSVFIESVVLLKTIHSISKEKGNNFTMINNLSETNATSDLSENPVFGFKAALIRLIGNMCWKNKKNQDIIHDLEGIQVILDCCCIDEKNLFITQWCILAIHNICDSNIENQKVLASISSKGFMDAKKLQDMGIMLNKTKNGDSLYLMPLEKSDSTN